MKRLVALLGLSAAVGSLAQTEAPKPSPSTPVAKPETVTAVSPAKPVAGTPAAPAGKPEAKKTDPKKTDAKKKEEPKIEGIVIERANGAYLGLKLENGTYKLSFYDAKKKPVAPDVSRAAARWNPQYKQFSERAILNPSADGKALVGGKPVRPPYTFKLYLTLLKGEAAADGEGGQAVESFVIDFHA